MFFILLQGPSRSERRARREARAEKARANRRTLVRWALAVPRTMFRVTRFVVLLLVTVLVFVYKSALTAGRWTVREARRLWLK